MTLEDLEYNGSKSLKMIREGLRGLTCLNKCWACEELPYGVCTFVVLEEIGIWWIQILEYDLGRIEFDMFEKSFYMTLEGIGGILIWSVHAYGVRGIEIFWMQILE